MMLTKRLYTLLSLVIVASLNLAACAPEGSTPSPQAQIPTGTAEVLATPTVEPEDEPIVEAQAAVIVPELKHPDTFVDYEGDPETLDPAWMYSVPAQVTASHIYEGLVWFNKDRADEFVPMLSTGWDVNPAGDVWTFDVREGVTFHEGGTLEPHDVAYSLQRALLQDRSGGPQWMALEAFFGQYAIKGLAIETAGVASFEDVSQEGLIATCERVKAVVAADDAAGTVTYRLARPTPWFLTMLALPFIGAVVDMEWMVEQGAWDGDCATWVQYHDPVAEETVLYNRSNGTGPYILDHWISGEEHVLVANESYWRQEGDPMWEGGPSGVPRIKRVIWKKDIRWATRVALFEAGEFDTLILATEHFPQFEPYYKTLCRADGRCEDVNPDGYIQAWRDLPSTFMWFALFNQRINVEGSNPFAGSGQLDGQGVPPDFFQDVHVRRAFNYCFDFATLIADALNGDGVQAQGPIMAGTMGYRERESPLYTYDLARCEEEFQQAFDGALWEQGFYMQLPYVINTGGQLFPEIVKAGLEAVNPGFSIEVVAVPGPELNNSLRTGKLPIYFDGAVEDFHDPHNFVHAFLHSQGALSPMANLPDEIAAEYDALIEKAASLTTVEARRPLYEQLQLKAQQDAIAIWMFQPVNYKHFQSWIKGFYFNPAWPFVYVYALSKEAP